MSVKGSFAILLLLGIFPVAAEDAQQKTPDPKERYTLERFGLRNMACAEWSDGCAVCIRKDGPTMACSTPGIACQPVDTTCRREAQKIEPPEKPSK